MYEELADDNEFVQDYHGSGTLGLISGIIA
jgi:hypothetical protein